MPLLALLLLLLPRACAADGVPAAALALQGAPTPESDAAAKALATGKDRIAAGDLAGAEGLWSSQLGRGEDSALLYALGGLRFRLRRLAQSQDCFERLARRDPQRAEAWYRLGLVRAARGAYRSATDAQRIAVGHAPAFGRAYCALALDLRECGQTAEGLWAAREALRLMPGYAGAWNLLGNLQQDSGDSEGALASYGNAVRLVPDYVVAWCNLAGLLEAAGRRDEAGRAYDRALKADPACSDARLMRAQLDMDRRSFGEARRDYLACAQDTATEPEARWGLYRIDKIEGRPREAAQQLAGYYSAVRRRDESLQALAADGREQPSAYEPSLPPPESGANTPWESHP